MKILTLVLLLFLIGCINDNGNLYYIRFTNVSRLGRGSYVYYKGVNVGKVESIALSKNLETIVGIKIDKKFKLTKSSQFSLVPLDSFGSQVIEVSGSMVGEYLTEYDTVDGVRIVKKPLKDVDSTDVKFIMDSVLKVKVKEN